MSSKNEQFLLIIKQYWGPTCARDIKKKYKSSSLKSHRVSQPGQGKGEKVFGESHLFRKARYVAAGCSINIVSNVDNVCF